MPAVFKTEKGSPAVEMVGVGVAGPDGKGGVPVERAAEVFPELQEKNEDGSLKLDDDGNSIPLVGQTLNAAARKLAEARGLTVAQVSEDQIPKLGEEWGGVPEGPTVEEVSKEEYERMYGHLEEDKEESKKHAAPPAKEREEE